MKSSFRAVVVALVLAGSASAQFTTYVPQQGTCAIGQCPRAQAAVTQVRSTAANSIYRVGDGIHRIGDIVVQNPAASPIPARDIAPVSGVVQGVWSAPVTPWYPTLPTVVPQEMPAPQRTPIFPRLRQWISGN